MQGRLAALSSKYDSYLVSNFIDMHYVSLDSHRKMLYYDINNIVRIALLVEGFEIRKTTFYLITFELGSFSQ